MLPAGYVCNAFFPHKPSSKLKIGFLKGIKVLFFSMEDEKRNLTSETVQTWFLPSHIITLAENTSQSK